MNGCAHESEPNACARSGTAPLRQAIAWSPGATRANPGVSSKTAESDATGVYLVTRTGDAKETPDYLI
jgi:hypothetical protein